MSEVPGITRPFRVSVPILQFAQVFSKPRLMGQTQSTVQTAYGTIGQAKQAQKTPDFRVMSDDDIKTYCKGGDLPSELTCIKNALDQRRQEKCETVNGVTTCSKVVASELGQGLLAPPPDYKVVSFSPTSVPAASMEGMKTVSQAVVGYSVSGYVAEGSQLSPMMRSSDVWLISIAVVAIALIGLKSK